MRIRYASKNLLRARGRLLISLSGIAFAAFLMAVQGSLLHGFTMAASRVVDAVEGDIWIVAPGIPAFDFVSPLEERIAWLVQGAPGVAGTGRGIAGWAPFEKVNGDRTFVFVVGVDRTIRGLLPDVAVETLEAGHHVPLGFDATDRKTLGGDVLPARVQVSRRDADLAIETRGFASFLGTPFVFGDFSDIRRFLPYDRNTVSFVTVRTHPDVPVQDVRDALRSRFPSVSIWTAEEFSWRSRLFWLVQTGAGGALSLAALLGFLIGLSVVAQTIYSLTAESVEEFATLKAMGASNGYLFSIVLTQSLLCGLVGSVVGLAGVHPFASLAQSIVTWMVVPGWMYGVVLSAIAILCTAAAWVAANPAISAEPARVFRA